MNRQTTTALVLIAFLAIVFIFNVGGRVSVNLLIVEFSTIKALVFLGFTAAGTLIGLLLK